jgi:hypothetical protein
VFIENVHFGSGVDCYGDGCVAENEQHERHEPVFELVNRSAGDLPDVGLILVVLVAGFGFVLLV